MPTVWPVIWARASVRKWAMADFVGHFGLGQFALGLADGADLGCGVDAGRDVAHQRAVGFALDHVGAGVAALDIGSARQ